MVSSSNFALREPSYKVLKVIGQGYIRLDEITEQVRLISGEDEKITEKWTKARVNYLAEYGYIRNADQKYILTEYGKDILDACAKLGDEYSVFLEKLPTVYFEILGALIKANRWVSMPELFRLVPTCMQPNPSTLYKLVQAGLVYQRDMKAAPQSRGNSYYVSKKGGLVYEREKTRRGILEVDMKGQ